MSDVTKLSFRLLIGLIALFAAGKVVLSDTMDPDAFWHLQVGDQLVKEGIHPIVDDISFNSIREPWSPYSWLGELMMRAIWKAAGLGGAVLFTAVMSAGFIFLLAASCSTAAESDSENGARYLPTIVATAVGAFMSLPNISFRPVTIAMVLLALCAWLLLRDRRMNERSREVWLVPGLTVLIINIHFFAILVPLWVGALMVGALAEKRDFKRYRNLLAACLIACLMTPMLPGAVRTILHYQQADPMVASAIIAELRPAFLGFPGIVTGLVLASLIGCFMLSHSKLRVGELIWLGGMLLLAGRYNRFSPMFALIACPLIARTLPGFSDRVLARKTVATAAAAVLAIGILRLSAAVPPRDMNLSTWLNRNGAEAPGYPCRAAEFVASHVTPTSGRLINEFSWGGYLSWKLGAHYQVFLDERTQLYPPEFWKRVYFSGAYELRDTLASSRADVAILPVERSRFRPALDALGWKLLYRDERAEVMVPPGFMARTE